MAGRWKPKAGFPFSCLPRYPLLGPTLWVPVHSFNSCHDGFNELLSSDSVTTGLTADDIANPRRCKSFAPSQRKRTRLAGLVTGPGRSLQFSDIAVIQP